MKWIAPRDIGTSASGKTRIWHIITRDENQFILGEVKWFGRWRKYAFFPSEHIVGVFEEDCLRDIADFIEAQTKEHKQK